MKKGTKAMTLNIIYEDKDILVCFKPAGVATQTASVSQQDMVSLIKKYLGKQGGKAPYVGIIHRLDQPVSGLLVFAKNPQAAAELSRQIQNGIANKHYIAFCEGGPEKKQGTLIHYIRKNSMTKLAEISSKEAQGEYKKAVLDYEVEKELEDASIIKVHLQTGRFHQIRAQFSFIGNPLLGDTKYGTNTSKELSMRRKINKVALCAYRLVLKHPGTGKTLEFTLDEKYLPEWYKA